MQSLTEAGRRIVLLAFGSLVAAAAAVEAASIAGAHGMAAAAPICAALLLIVAAALWGAGGRLTGAMRAAEDAAARSRSEMQAALDNMSQGLVLCDRTANVVAVNNRFLHLFDIPTVGVRPGMSVASLIRLQAAAGEWAAELTEALVHERLNRPPGASGRLVMPFRESLFEVAYQPRVEGGWACTFEDVTAQKEAERRIAHLAQHDSLTGLPNRAVLRERIDAAIAADSAFAAMFLDLDDFKLANDTYGHAVGDALLCAVAERLRARMRLGDIVARLGGDEFAVLLIAPCSPEEADRHAAQLVRALAEPFQVEEHMLRIGVSIGISLTPNGPGFEGAPSADMLLRQADIALYRAKEDGGGAHRFFETPMTQRPFVDNAPIATAWTGA